MYVKKEKKKTRISVSKKLNNLIYNTLPKFV